MKKVSKGIEPEKLNVYRQVNPTNTWEEFTSKKSRRKGAQESLKADQGGLCAYCEIDLLDASDQGKADFRVEHFHPKSDTTTSHNWHLDWANLLGCCHGGSQKDIASSNERFTSPDHSCDVLKGQKNLDGLILNPLTLPAFPRLFSCERLNGAFSVDIENCRQSSIEINKAQNTINELCLDTNRLRCFRKASLNQLNDQMQNLLSNGFSISEARERLAKSHLRKNKKGRWPTFFTSIRSYLGKEAEQQLRDIHYDG